MDAKKNAFDYQENAVKSKRDLEYSAVFHEQGLGKSKIAIDTILYWLQVRVIDTILLIAKKTLVHNWVRELKNHTHIEPLLITNDAKSNFYVFNSPSRLVLTH